MTVLLLPGIAPLIPPVPEAGLQAGLHDRGRGHHRPLARAGWRDCWCWRCRSPGQFISYMLGVANVLQPDPGARRPGDADRAAVRPRRTARHPGDRPLRAAAGGACRQLSADPAGHAAARGGHRRNRGRARWRTASRWRCASPRRSCWSPSSGMSRPACSPGWCRACRSTSSPCPDRSSAASRCSPSLATALLTAWQDSGPSRLRRVCRDCDRHGRRAQQEERTEAATPRRLQRAREEGQVPVSRELARPGRSGGGHPGSGHGRRPARRTTWRCGSAYSWRGRTNWRPAASTFRLAGLAWLRGAAPFVLAAMLAGVAVVLVQTRFLLSGKALRVDFSRISPRRGPEAAVRRRTAWSRPASRWPRSRSSASSLWRVLLADLPGLLLAPFGDPSQLARHAPRARCCT